MSTTSKTANDVLNDYLHQLDNFEIELSEQEQNDLDELNKLIQNRKDQNDLSTDIWNTIQKAAIDSVEQIIGLSDRGDWRPDQGAVITTPLNFREGIVASEADRKRYEMWNDRVSGNTQSASEFRADYKRFKSSYESEKKRYKDSKRNLDGSYNNEYNGTKVYDQNDPRTYRNPDTSGDMARDTRKTVNVDHIISVKELHGDDLLALYGGATPEGFDQTMRDIANNSANFAISDEHVNKSMKDKDALETAKNNPELNMNYEEVKTLQKEAKQAKNEYLRKNALGEKSKELITGVAKSTLAATGKMLVGKALKITISETVIEFKNKSDEDLMERVKQLIKRIIKRAKDELAYIWSEIKDYAANNAISEIVNLILNYFVSTVKNVFKLIRCLFGSIVKAFKIILDSTQPWEDRLFEALKIISAGIAMATGAMLNELIAKLISTYIPFLAGYAGDISAVISGLISSILSAIVLMAFDRYKASIQIKDEERKVQLLQMQLVGNHTLQSYSSSVRTSVIVAQTIELVKQEMMAIANHNAEIENAIARTRILRQEIKDSQDRTDVAQRELEATRTTINNEFNNKLNNLMSINHE